MLIKKKGVSQTISDSTQRKMFRARAMEQCPIACARKNNNGASTLRLFLRLLKLEERLSVNESEFNICASPWSSFSPGGYKLVICFLYEESPG